MDLWDGGDIKKISQQLGRSCISDFTALEEWIKEKEKEEEEEVKVREGEVEVKVKEELEEAKGTLRVPHKLPWSHCAVCVSFYCF